MIVLGYLSKLVDEYDDMYHQSIDKRPKASKFKVGDKVSITKYKNVFSKGYPGNWSKEIFVIDFVLEVFTKKGLLLSKL